MGPALGEGAHYVRFWCYRGLHLLVASISAFDLGYAKTLLREMIRIVWFPQDLAEDQMKRFVEGTDREQSTLFPECLEDWIHEDNPVRVIDVFVDQLDLGELGFEGVTPEATGRPSYHPSVLLKLYIYGYLNRVQSSRRLEPLPLLGFWM